MALFGSARDASFVRRINRELIQSIIDTEVELYKISAEYTKTNLYGESKNKVYYNPVVVASLISRDTHESIDTNQVLDFTRSATFGFIRDDLKDLGLYLEEGDVVLWDGEYYELKNVYDDQLWMGRNPDTLLGNVRNQINEHGFNISVIAVGHVIRANNLNLVSTRTNTTNTKRKDIYNNF